MNSKWGMFLIYTGFCVFSFFIVYMFIPETRNLPVEEIGALFGDPVVVHLTADGEGIVEDKQLIELDEKVEHRQQTEAVVDPRN